MQHKLFAFVLFLFFTSGIIGQTEQNISISFNNTPLKEAVLQVETLSNKKFYFDEAWLNGYFVTKEFESQPLRNVLEEIFSNTNINFVFVDGRVILLNNTYVYTELPADYFNEEDPDKNIIQENNNAPIFEEEYSAQQNVQKRNLVTIGKQRPNSANKTYVLTGIIKNDKTGEPLQNLSISTVDRKRYAVTDANGRFSIQLPYGLNELETNLLGFERIRQDVIMYGDGSLNLSLRENTESLEEVVVKSKKDANVRDAVVGVTNINIEAIKTIPLVLGERDILKVATTMPGIKTTGEGSSGFNVRGGRADQNLILLDDAVLYNPSHFLGFFSAVNPFTTGSLEIYKASIPAEYGGRLSSVFDIETKTGDMEKFKGEGSVGPITANLAVEVPLIKEKASVIAGFRATYSDWILRSLDEEELKNSEASFYDGIVKYKHNINSNNFIQGTFYYSKDRFSITSDSIFNYNNRLISLKYGHNFSEKSRAELILVNSQYKYGINYEADANEDFNFGYELNEYQAKLNFNYNISPKHKLSYGLSSKLYSIDPGDIEPIGTNSDVEAKTLDREKGLESAIYLADLFEVTDKLLLDLGLRYSFYSALGPATQNVYAEGVPKSESSIIEVKEFDNNQTIKTYNGPEYRFSGRYLLGNEFSVKAGFNRTIQYLHLLSTNTTQSPTDIWKLSDLNIAPQRANQYSLGFFKNLSGKDLEFSIEGYYKTMDDLLDYKIGAQLVMNEDLETELLQGEGKAYGVEFLVKKNSGRFNGYLGYSFSRSLVKLDSQLMQERVNNGEFFSANYDKPHDFSMVANYKLTKRFSFSGNFTYQTGRPITYPIGRYVFAGEEQVLYSDRNQYRIPDYFRLDLGVNIEGNHKLNKLAHSFINISVYNVLGRNNPYSVFFVNEQGQIKAYQTSIFSVPVPTITYNFKF
ncbi:carboxypeptidase-like regulatory domain-containing protein [Aequorivita sp. SDUM287046]|uniref:Carboxypeptidase-like regulatory domain-containing protein n=1 Tax=Aequorivita aurantiaca TaxID=3053356 RepID=A0ABT8DK94_9FLAO|nr:carboxypeptidase-like regulatory domain-containing protein [Aequorivita aurantiaca]MDN3723668.1 carboxypeptidase-like regulatory domain-containing protein [Aequorivita aurantiaca]